MTADAQDHRQHNGKGEKESIKFSVHHIKTFQCEDYLTRRFNQRAARSTSLLAMYS
jgi:hypothetical protein